MKRLVLPQKRYCKSFLCIWYQSQLPQFRIHHNVKAAFDTVVYGCTETEKITGSLIGGNTDYYYLQVEYSYKGNSLVLSGDKAILTVRKESTANCGLLAWSIDEMSDSNEFEPCSKLE